MNIKQKPIKINKDLRDLMNAMRKLKKKIISFLKAGVAE